ncbi:MAG: hypothetical protein J5736_04035, partial [Bacilli bacterium]|nr:hypothetical protein [Bacilli bacterium]
MNQSKHSLLRLLQIAEEKRILVIEPSLLNKDAEELTSSEDIYKLTLDNTEYRFVLNDAIKASSGVGFDKFEHINRGSKVINAVLDAVFGKYNSLVVRHAKFDPASIPNIDNIARPALGNGLSCHRISLALGAGSSSDYKIQVGLTVEIKDSITNGITIRKFLTHATVDFDKNTGNPHFDLKMVFQPENMDTDPTFEPVADINLNEFKEQIEIIRSFISKEETKREIFQGLIENDPDIRDYLHDRERKINPLIDSEPLVEFNIIPMSVSMNKVPKMTAQYQIFASEVAEPLAEVSTAEDFNPFEENLQVAYSCPHCGARCDKNNPLVEVINKDDAPAIGCLHCSTNDVASVYDFRNARFFIDELEREQADRFGNPFKKGQGDYYRPDDLRECYASHYRVYKGYTEEALDEHDRPVFVLDKYRTNDLSPIYGGKYYLSSLVAEDEEEPGQKYLIRDMGKCAITQKLVHKDRLVDAFKGADKQVVHVLKTLTEIGFNPGYHDGERYLSEALANDENTKKRYLKSDLRHDDTTGLLSYKETLIHFDYGFDQNGKELPKGGLCIPEHSSKCPNCQKIMGAKDIATRI